MSSPSFEQQLTYVLDKVRDSIHGALVTFAQDAPSGDLVTLRCEFSASEPWAPRGTIRYGDLILGELWLPSPEVVILLSGLTKGTAVLEERPILDIYEFSTGVIVERQLFSRAGLTDGPEWTFELRRKNGPRYLAYMGAPSVQVGQRPYKSVALAVAEWVWGHKGPWHGGNPPHHGEAIIAFPDTRARISAVDWMTDRMRVRVASSIARDELFVQVILHDIGTTFALEQKSPNSEGVVEWPIAPTTSAAELYLVHESEGLLWHREYPNSGHKVEERGTGRTPEEIAAADLENGESQRVEFKPFLNSLSDEKSKEVVETVVAFANSAGGRLYVGVRNNSEPQGVSALVKAAGSDRSRAEKEIFERMDSLIRENVKPTPAFSMRFVVVAGNPVLMVNVERGGERPYATHGNDVFIRKAATNRKIDPHTELPALYLEDSRWTSASADADERGIVSSRGLVRPR